ncbi:MAG: hypothetical protein LBB49_05995, partial [Gracilibacteraceae bacterium]|nr:hypothetical protein [Gracilibacteraceae bacterium]
AMTPSTHPQTLNRNTSPQAVPLRVTIIHINQPHHHHAKFPRQICYQNLNILLMLTNMLK